MTEGQVVQPPLLSTLRRRTARVSLAYASCLGILMLLGMPREAWVFGASKGDQATFVVILAVVAASIWTNVALGRRRPYARRVAMLLGVYALVQLVTRGPAIYGYAQRLDDPFMRWTFAFTFGYFLALLVAGLACWRNPLGKAESPTRAV